VLCVALHPAAIDVFQLNLAGGGTASPAPQSPPPRTPAVDRVSVTDFEQAASIGALGHPLGQITTISGVVQPSALGTKSSNSDLVLSIESINDCL
jgi:hypothetical protein